MIFLTIFLIAVQRHHSEPHAYRQASADRRSDNDRSQSDATHAWVEVWLPTIGWVGFDPTNNMLTGERHITVAIGRDYADVTPTRGIYRGLANEELTVSVRINDDTIQSPIIHNARPAWPAENIQQQQQQQ